MNNYDTWILQGPDDRHDVGIQDGDTCGRYAEPDEDAHRGYKPKPCQGVMAGGEDNEGEIVCDTCGEIA